MSEAVSVERRIVSVLFADLVGFTTLAEQLDAEDVATIQDAYFAAVRQTVARYGGVLEKFIGDAAMAVFGAPRARDDDAERAARAGLALVAAVEQLGARLGLEAGSLQLRVGVNSGEVVHATDGPDAGRVTGDTVNTAARLQAAARPNAVLVGEVTALAVGESMALGDATSIELKGKAEPVRAREVQAVRAEPSRDEALGGLRSPLLGRGDELARLRAILDEPAGAALVTVVAPPGVGKSRLVSEVATDAAERGARVLHARVRPQAASPFEAVAQLLAAAGAPRNLPAALTDAGGDPARAAVVVAEVEALLAPELGGLPAAADLAAERERRFAGWVEALDALAAGSPQLWVAEDVHWAAADLLAFLRHAGSAAGRARRVVLATARPSILDAAADWASSVELLELGTLPPLDAAGLIRALVADALPDSLVEAIAERSDGNPLFIEELLRTWISVGTLVPVGAGWRLAVEPDEVSLPATVQAIYAAQLDDLPPDARLVARRASVAGRRFPEGALEPLELRDRRDGLEVLRRRAFVAGPLADSLGDRTFAFRHALLRDAGYASLARLERARLHAALAGWLHATAGARGADVAQLVAEHYADAVASLPALTPAGSGLDRTALSSSAAEAFERAAAAALAVSAHESAARLFGRAVEHTDPGATIDLARRRLRLGEILADAADLDAGIAEMLAALEALAAELPDAAPLYAEAAHRLGLAWMQQIRFPEAEQLTGEALRRLAAAGPAVTTRLHALHAWAVAAQGRDDGAGDEARAARRAAADLGDPNLEIDVLEHYAATVDELGAEDRSAWSELETHARRLGRWRQAVIAARIRGMMTADEQPAEGLVLLDAAAELAAAHGLTEQRGWTDLGRAETLWVVGRWDEALAAAVRAIELGERYAYDRLAFRTWMVVLPLIAARRDPSLLARWEAWWAAAQPSFPSPPSPYGAALHAAIARWVAQARGEPPGAAPPPDLADVIPPMSNPHFVATIETIVEAWLEDGLRAPAEALAARCRAWDADGDTTPLMRASLALLEAWLAQDAGNRPTAEGHAQRALEAASRVGAPWWQLRALRALGRPTAEPAAALGVPG